MSNAIGRGSAFNPLEDMNLINLRDAGYTFSYIAAHSNPVRTRRSLEGRMLKLEVSGKATKCRLELNRGLNGLG